MRYFVLAALFALLSACSTATAQETETVVDPMAEFRAEDFVATACVNSVANDFDGDGVSDIGPWLNQETNLYVIWFMEDGEKVSSGSFATVNRKFQIFATGDYNGDCRADIAWRNVQNGAIIVWLMDGLEVKAKIPVGGPGPIWCPWNIC